LSKIKKWFAKNKKEKLSLHARLTLSMVILVVLGIIVIPILGAEALIIQQFAVIMAVFAALLIVILAVAIFFVSRLVKKEREAHELTQTIIDTAPFVINLWDDSRNLLSTSQYAVDLFGVSSKDEYIEKFYEFSMPYQPCGTPSGDLIPGMLTKAYEEGFTKFEWMHRALDGKPLSTEITIVRFERNGKPMLVAYTADLREVKVAQEKERVLEKKLREREMNERLQLILNSGPVGVVCFDASRTMFDCNEEAVRIFGFDDKVDFIKSVSEDFTTLFTPVQPCGTPTSIKISWIFGRADAGARLKYDVSNLTKDGEELPSEVTIQRIDYDDTYMFVAYIQDLREAKKAEAERKRIEVAEESNRAKSAFLARMSHEIRTPITAVMGISEIHLRNPDLPPLMEESFAKIHNSANLLLGIINDILDISKIEAGKMSLLQVEYDVASSIRNITHMHSNFKNSEPITFDLRVDDNLPAYLVGDSLRIEQVVNNLLSNAFKYTMSGSVEVSWGCSEHTGKEGYIDLVISINDTGLGMTNQQLEVLQKNEYTRFHEGDSRNVSGTGLGIPIVCSLLKLMDANINFNSEVGKGTNVVVTIPQKLSSKTEIIGSETAGILQKFDESIQSSKMKLTFIPEHMPYGKVLVVDDVEANLYVMRGLLAFYELSVETCQSGHEALALIKQGRVYDIVFMDHMMPELNGTETMQAIRETGYTEPIVILTANALLGKEEEFIRSGFDGFVSKPIQAKSLNAILVKYIKDKQPPEVIEAVLLAQTKKVIEADTRVDINDYLSSGELVQKLRVDFAKLYANLFFDISHAVNTNDTKTAHLLTHTLKSSAGSIHEPSLAQIAGHLEHKLANGETPTAGELSALEIELSRVLLDIGEPEIEVYNIDEYLDRDATFALWNKLEPLLYASDAQSLELLDELRKIQGTEELCRQIENYDFEIAQSTLKTLMRQEESSLV